MGTIQEIENAVQGLSDDDLAQFRTWFADFDYARWDRQLADDVAAGRLDGPYSVSWPSDRIEWRSLTSIRANCTFLHHVGEGQIRTSFTNK